MALTSLQVCMDSSDWLQGTVNDQENGMDSSSPSGGDNILMCSRPLIERRLRPPHDQALKCPRCDSTHTKFCYYNNYSLSQPRYFCKTCRRYWTKGGTLRNIPVGGGCRKNKKVSNSKKSSSSSSDNNIAHAASVIVSSTDLHLSSPDMQFSHLNTLLAADHHGRHGNGTTSFIDSKYNAFLGTNTARPIDQFMNHNFMGGDHLGIMSSNVVNDHHYQTFQENAGGTTFNTNSTTTTTPLYGGMSLEYGNNINSYHGAFIDTCQRLMLPNYEDDDQNDGIEVKPNTKLLALEWQQQADDGDDHLSVKDHNHHSFGYVNAGTLGSWNGLMNGYGSSATNPSLV